MGCQRVGSEILQFEVGRDPAWLDRRDVCTDDATLWMLIGKVSARSSVLLAGR